MLTNTMLAPQKELGWRLLWVKPAYPVSFARALMLLYRVGGVE